jgi:hypothetical protein
MPVLVLALSSLVLGGLGLAGAGVMLAVCWTYDSAGSPGVVVPLLPSAAEYCRAFVPGFRALEILLPAAALLGAALVLGSGLALFSLRRWARVAAVATAAAVLAGCIVTALYEFAVLLPAVETWREDSFRRNPGPRQFVADVVPAGPRWVALLLLLGGLVYFVHAVATLVVLHVPAVAEGFAPGERTPLAPRGRGVGGEGC